MDALQKVVTPEAWAAHASLGYELPPFLKRTRGGLVTTNHDSAIDDRVHVHRLDATRSEPDVQIDPRSGSRNLTADEPGEELPDLVSTDEMHPWNDATIASSDP